MAKTTVLGWAREQRVGHAVTKAVLLILAAHSDRGGLSWPSTRTLAQEAEVDQRTVRRHTDRLQELGLLTVIPGAGRGSNRYQLAVDSEARTASQDEPVARRLGASQDRPRSEAPKRRTTPGRSEAPEDRSEAYYSVRAPVVRRDEPLTSNNASRSNYIEEELLEGSAPPPPARASALAHTRGGRSGERATAVELAATAHSPAGYALVAGWAAANPGVLSSHRRDLGRAVDDLLARGADPSLIPAALTEAHDRRFRSPAKALPLAYEDVRRAAQQATQPPAPAVTGPARIPTTTQRVQGALALLRPDGDQP